MPRVNEFDPEKWESKRDYRRAMEAEGFTMSIDFLMDRLPMSRQTISENIRPAVDFVVMRDRDENATYAIEKTFFHWQQMADYIKNNITCSQRTKQVNLFDQLTPSQIDKFKDIYASCYYIYKDVIDRKQGLWTPILCFNVVLFAIRIREEFKLNAHLFAFSLASDFATRPIRQRSTFRGKTIFAPRSAFPECTVDPWDILTQGKIVRQADIEDHAEKRARWGFTRGAINVKLGAMSYYAARQDWPVGYFPETMNEDTPREKRREIVEDHLRDGYTMVIPAIYDDHEIMQEQIINKLHKDLLNIADGYEGACKIFDFEADPYSIFALI